MHPILFQVGDFKLYSFGLMMVIAFFSALTFARFRAKRYGMTPDEVGDMSFWALLGGILGARAMFIAQEWDHYSKNLKELFSLQFQGLTSFGGILVGGLVIWLWAKKKKLPVLQLLDLASGPFLLGHIFGRIGCLLNGCCYGHVCPTGFPFGVHSAEARDGLLHYPAQAFDSLMNVAALGILIVLERRGLKLGQSTGIMLILHGLARFIYEFWRIGSSSTRWGSLPITEAQAVALLLVAIGAGLYLWSMKKAMPAQLGSESNEVSVA